MYSFKKVFAFCLQFKHNFYMGDKSNKKIDLSPEDIEWIKLAHSKKVHPKFMASRLNIHIDTMRRLLDRYGILPATQAKHMAHSEEDNSELWTRPCIKCKCDKPRQKWQYICNPCTEKNKKSLGVDVDFLQY